MLVVPSTHAATWLPPIPFRGKVGIDVFKPITSRTLDISVPIFPRNQMSFFEGLKRLLNIGEATHNLFSPPKASGQEEADMTGELASWSIAGMAICGHGPVGIRARLSLLICFLVSLKGYYNVGNWLLTV